MIQHQNPTPHPPHRPRLHQQATQVSELVSTLFSLSVLLPPSEHTSTWRPTRTRHKPRPHTGAERKMGGGHGMKTVDGVDVRGEVRTKELLFMYQELAFSPLYWPIGPHYSSIFSISFNLYPLVRLAGRWILAK